MSMEEMDFADKTFDIIWSEGALYFMGFQNGLKKCRQLLKDNGYLAVSEFVYLVSNPPKEVVEFSKNEFSEIKDIQSNIELIKNEGFRLLSHFTLPESAWLDSYYAPMQKEIFRMREKYKDNKDALAVFDMLQHEINFYKKYSKYYGYEFFIMQKTIL
jgi:SAM-dependent methyltransferase